MSISKGKYTRGHGFLEKTLSKLRCGKVNFLLKDINKEGTILDIGCGPVAFFLQQTQFKNKFGLDKALPENLKNRGVTIKKWDTELNDKLPFKDNLFEVVTMLAVFEHIEVKSLIPLIKEINRVLKKGGYYILTTPNGWTDPLLKFMAKTHIVSTKEVYDHKDIYTKKKVKNLLEKGGFKKEFIVCSTFELNMNIWAKAQK